MVPDGKFLPGPRVTKRLHDIFPPFHSTVHGLPLTRPFTRAEGVTLKFRVMKSAPGQWERWTVQARILEWVAFAFSRGIFPAQGWNPGVAGAAGKKTLID